ncbi:hypothetical protein SpCBS45565_g00677 [Spizellomyces sp. 'palustris']|nr:hypothetical protein SpCBS45565_g00677 [Spizellomyces sp. 'palustris']
MAVRPVSQPLSTIIRNGSRISGRCLRAAVTLPTAQLAARSRNFGGSGVQAEREAGNPVSKFINPIGYIKWKMSRIDSARHAYEACSLQFEKRPDFLQALNLPDNFQTWFAMTLLHVWIYNARLRAEGLEGKEMKQEIFDHIWLDVEIKIHKAGVKRQLSKIMSNLVSAYYGQSLAYDEGLYYGDAILAGALWRNLLGSQDVDAKQLESLVTYVRKQLQHIDQADRSEILEGRFSFADVKI